MSLLPLAVIVTEIKATVVRNYKEIKEDTVGIKIINLLCSTLTMCLRANKKIINTI